MPVNKNCLVAVMLQLLLGWLRCGLTPIWGKIQGFNQRLNDSMVVDHASSELRSVGQENYYVEHILTL